MNYISKEEFKLKSSYFDSPHGLANRFNTSSAADLAKLSSIALKNPQFAKIVKTKRYKCYSQKPEDFEKDNPGQEFTPKYYNWENTNKMLWRLGYNGLKTGITHSAGPCLATSFCSSLTNEHYIIILLNSKTMDHRWSEVSKLKDWASSRIQKLKKQC